MFKNMFQKPSSNISLSHEEERETYEDEVETVVGPSVHVEGDFNSAGNILVKGSVAGKVTTSRLLTVETGALVSADVKAADAIISGEIRGNAKIDNKLELTQTAKIIGDIKCDILVMHAGAAIRGKVVMPGLDEDVSSASKKSTSKGRGRAKKTTDTENEE